MAEKRRAKINWLKWYPGDFLRDTGHLTMTERGAYRDLIDHYYSTSQALPLDFGDLCRISRARSKLEQSAVRKAMGFFSEYNGRLHHKRIDEEIAKYVALASKNQKIAAAREATFRAKREHEACTKRAPDVDQTLHGSSTRTARIPEARVEATALRRPLAVVPGVSSLVWDSYEAAYEKRYRAKPVRNAKVNAQLKQFVQRIGADEAPSVAAFFVGHNAAFYAQRMHSIDCLLHDAEKLRTEWATGRKVHQTEARMNDQTASNPFLQILEERRLEASK